MIAKIIEVIIVILIIMTAVAYPRESVTYGTLMIKSGFKLVDWIVKEINKIGDDNEVSKNTESLLPQT